jgi:hypothetical protein
MLGGGITLISGEGVAWKTGVGFLHVTVPRNLGDNGCRGNRVADAVTLDYSLKWVRTGFYRDKVE